MAAYAIQFRRGTTAQHNSFTGLLGEVTVDTNKKTLVVHDGSTTGGFPLAREGANLASAEGSFSSNVTVGGTLEVTSTSVFNDDVEITGDLEMTGHIIPSANITYDLGSPTMMWKDIYVGPGSLYVNGKKVIEDNNGSINFTTDANETLKLVVPGATGTLQFSAGSLQLDGEINAITGDITFGDHLDMNSNRIKNVSAPVEGADATNKTYVDAKISSELSGGSLAIEATTGDFSGDVSVAGSLTVSGTVTTVNSETIELADNILLLNSNALGTASQNAGIEVERGDDLNVQLLWDETNNRWSLGAEDIKANAFIGNLTGDVTGDVTGTVSTLNNHTTSNLDEGVNLYWTEARGTANFDSNLAASDTDDLREGTNLYYTEARGQATFDTRLATKSTSNVAEGSNLYFTDARARSAISVSGDLTYNATTGVISTQGLASSDSDDLSEGTTNLYFTDARAQAAVASDISSARSGAVSSANAYTDQAEIDAVASAEAKDAVRATAANAYADQAEADAIAAAEAKDVVRASAAAADATSKADAAQAAAEATASADASTKANAAQAAAEATASADASTKATAAENAAQAYTDNRENAITTAYTAADTTLQSNIDTEKGRIDAIMSASTSDADTFAEIVSLVNSVDTTNDSALSGEIAARTSADTALQGNIDSEASARTSADSALSGRLDVVEGGSTVAGSVAKAQADAEATASADATAKADQALVDAKAYADTAEADAVASAEAKDVVRAAAAEAYADQAEADAIAAAEAKDVVRATAAEAYADQAEADAIASAEAKDVARALTASNDRAAIRSEFAAADTTLQSNIDTEKGRIDAIMSASTSDADTFAEIVSLVNSVDTTNDNGLAAEITARTSADTALSGRLDVIEGSGSGSVAKALVDAKAYADQAEADAETAAAADATSKADAALVAAKAYADQAEADAETAAASYTDARETAITSAYTSAISTAVAGKDNTDEITEGSNNLYYTDARADARVANATGSNLNLGNKTTSELSEGSNQYFTNARAVSAVEASLTHFHSAEQTVSAAVSTANASGSVSFTFSELAGADHYAVYLNRQLLRPGEFTANANATNNLTISTGILAEDDELEVVGFKL